MIKVYLSNKTGSPFDRKALSLMKKVIAYTMLAENDALNGEVALTLCGDDRIRELNREYRGIDKPTDVLSFPTFDYKKSPEYSILGDIVISTQRAERQAEEYGHSLLRELCFLCAHSALHLMGFDHVNDEEGRAYMERRQNEALAQFRIEK